MSSPARRPRRRSRRSGRWPVLAGTPRMISTQRGSASAGAAAAAGRSAGPQPERASSRCLVLHHDQRRLRRHAVPARGDQVRERGPVPRHRRRLTACPGQHERDVGVGRARDGVADTGGGPVRVGRVGDKPAPHRALVDPRSEQRRAVGRPPVAAVAAHLLRGHELSEPERDLVLGFSRCRDRGVLPAGQVDHPERAGVHIGDQPAGRVRPRIGRGGQRPQLADPRRRARRRGQVRRVDPAAQPERRGPQGGVGRERDDAGRPLAKTAPGAPSPPGSASPVPSSAGSATRRSLARLPRRAPTGR